ncbi:MAG: ABC transporter ATP-binding protein [Candidatus Fimenecus sp.]
MNKKEILKKLLKYIHKHKVIFIFGLISSTFSSIFMLSAPYLFGKAIDEIVGKGEVNLPMLIKKLIFTSITIVLSIIFSYLTGLANNDISLKIVKEIRNESIKKVKKLPLDFIDRHSIGDLVSRIISDADTLSDGLLIGFSQIFSGIITIILTVIFMFRTSAIISLCIILTTPLPFFTASFISKKTFKMFENQTAIRGAETTLVNEMIKNAKTVFANGYNERSIKRFKELNENLKSTTKNAFFYSALSNPSTRFINGIVFAMITLFGAFLILNGKLSVGGLSALLAYSNQYMKPFNDITDVISEFQNSLACAKRLFEFIDEKTELSNSSKELKDAIGNVEFNNVTFSYTKHKPLIKNFNLTVKAGQSVAIIGPTGAGKTTLINLLMRFYDINSGDIKIDGQSIYSVSRKSLRNNIGMVLQDTWIKNASVRDNINIGGLLLNDYDIIAAAKKSKSYNIIKKLPQGLDTILSENSLSVGERQLICITRIMLLNPSILILDEATSSIDTRTEILIQKAFSDLMKNKTSFVVAHRLSTIKNADIILVMNDGKVVEKGRHNELLKQNGLYKKLYESSFEK